MRKSFKGNKCNMLLPSLIHAISTDHFNNEKWLYNFTKRKNTYIQADLCIANLSRDIIFINNRLLEEHMKTSFILS